MSLSDKLANVSQPPSFPLSPKPPYQLQAGLIGVWTVSSPLLYDLHTAGGSRPAGGGGGAGGDEYQEAKTWGIPRGHATWTDVLRLP